MADIVERLRIIAPWERVDVGMDLLKEAANEITRLRAALREIADTDEVSIYDHKKGKGWRHQQVARAALGASND